MEVSGCGRAFLVINVRLSLRRFQVLYVHTSTINFSQLGIFTGIFRYF